jgi:hypothetical protein
MAVATSNCSMETSRQRVQGSCNLIQEAVQLKESHYPHDRFTSWIFA